MTTWLFFHHIFGLNSCKHFFYAFGGIFGMFFPKLFLERGLVTAIIKDRFVDQALTTDAFSNDNEEFLQDIENFEL